MDGRRVTDEELTALFDAGGSDAAVEGSQGLPPHVVPGFASLAERLFVASFQDLDDFLDLPLEVSEPVVTAVPQGDLERLAMQGAWASFEVTGKAEGRGWLVLPEISTRRLLARLLGSRDDQVQGVLGRLHQTSLEAPFEEVRSSLVRHLEEEGLPGRVAMEKPSLTPPALAGEVRLVRLECPFLVNDVTMVVCYFVEEGMAIRLADMEAAKAASVANQRAEEARAAAQAVAAEEAERAAVPKAGVVSSSSASAPAPASQNVAPTVTPAPAPAPAVSAPEEEAQAEAEAEALAAAEMEAVRSVMGPPPEMAAATPAEPLPSAVPVKGLALPPGTLQAYLGQARLAGGSAALAEGMTLRLDRPAGDLVDLVVDGRFVGVGRVTVVDDHYGIEVVSLQDGGGAE